MPYYPFINNNSNTKSMDSSISQIFQMPYFPILLASLVFFLVKYLKKSGCQSKFPPGPKQLPIIGNLHHMIGGLPHRVLTRLSKKYGPVMKLQLGQVTAVVISSPEAAKEVLKTREISFAQRPIIYAVELMAYDNPSSFIFAPYDEYWRQVKKIAMSELLSTKRVQSFRFIREEEVWNLVEFISSYDRQVINLTNKIFCLNNDIISRTAFGSKCKDQTDFLIALQEIVDFCAGFNIMDLYPSLTFLRSATGAKSKLLRIRKKMDKIVEDIVTKHNMKRNIPAENGNDQEDIVDTLLNHAEINATDIYITVNQVKGIILDLFSAGSETSSTTIEWTMAELLKNPRVMKKAQEEVRKVCEGKNKIEEADIQKLEYLNCVIKETFRLHPPAPLYPRLATERCEINGYTIPANTKIIINPFAIGRDPTFWINPERFQPERFEGLSIDFKGNNFELLPFGSGKRICPGVSFAITNIELTLAQLLYHFDWKLAGAIQLEDLDMTEKFAATSKRKNNLQVIPTVHVPFHK